MAVCYESDYKFFYRIPIKMKEIYYLSYKNKMSKKIINLLL